MFYALAGSAYNNILSQYNDNPTDPTAYIHNTTQLVDTLIDTTAPPTNVTLDAIGSEAADALANGPGNWTDSPDTQFLVFPQQGTQYDSFFDSLCGVHNYGAATSNGASVDPFLIFGMEKYPGPGCTPGTSDAADATVVASHEYAEAATDPHADGSGWATDECWLSTFCSWNFNEIGDLCNQTVANIADAISFSAVQKLWDNYANDCVSGHGQDYYSSNTGKHTVQNQILDKYVLLGETSFVIGFPKSEEYPMAGGRVSDFQYGSIYWSSQVTSGAHEVHGWIYNEYQSLGGPGSWVGFPTSDEYGVPGGRATDFQGARIYWADGIGPHEVHGPILDKYVSLGATGSFLGFPTSDQYGVPGGVASDFVGQNATIYYSGDTGAHEVQGLILNTYRNLGGTTSWLGFPTSDEYSVPGGRESDFQHGYIVFNASNNQCTVYSY